MAKPLRALSLAVAVVALAACSGSSKHVYRDQFQKIIAPANAAVATFDTQENALRSSATGPDAARIADPLATAINHADRKLLRVSWPANVLPDIKTFVAAASVVVVDLENGVTQRPFTVNAWRNQLSQDERTLLGRASVVRADLGLRTG